MGRHGLHADLRRHAPDLGLGGRPPRLQADLPARARAVHGRVAALLPVLEPGQPDHLPRPPGRRRGLPHAGRHGHRHPRVPARTARHGPGLLGHRLGRLRVPRPHDRRLPGRPLLLAHDLRRQRPRRHRRDRGDHPHPAGVQVREGPLVRPRRVPLRRRLPGLPPARPDQRQLLVEHGRLDLDLYPHLLRPLGPRTRRLPHHGVHGQASPDRPPAAQGLQLRLGQPGRPRLRPRHVRQHVPPAALPAELARLHGVPGRPVLPSGRPSSGLFCARFRDL